MARDDEWEYSEGDEDEWEYDEGPSAAGSFAGGAAQGATFNLGDEMEGAQQGTAAALLGAGSAALRGDWEGVKDAPRLGLETYRTVRDGRRAANRLDSEVNPTATTVGNVAGAIGTGIATGGVGAGLRAAVATGALEGAASGFGANEDDLTYQDTEAYARAFRDTLEGGATGAAFGAGGYGAGKVVRAVGTRARGALGRARGQLADEARAGLDAEADALRAADAKAEARMGEVQGRAMEANKAINAGKAREEARRVAKAARESARASRQRETGAVPGNVKPGRAPVDPTAEPDTKVLRGFRGKAGERRAVNFDRVEAYRKDLANPEWKGDRPRVAQYVDDYADAVDNAGAFERRMVERYVRENYAPEVAERILRERVGPSGEILPRRAAPSPNPPAPQQSATPEADAVLSQALRDNPAARNARPLSDGTRARIERDAERVVRGAWDERTMIPGPEDVVRQGRAAEAIRQGGGGRSAFDGYGSEGRTIVADVPVGGRSFSQDEVVARHKNAKQAPAEAWRSWREWETAPQTVVDGAPPIPEGYRRLYRVEGVEPGDATLPVRGNQWFTDRLGVADEGLRYRSGQERMVYTDVPEADARRLLALNQSAPRFAKNSSDPGREWALPDRMARRAEEYPVPRQSTAELEDYGDIAAESQGKPQWNRGIDGPFLADEDLVETVAGPRPVAPVGASEVTGGMQPIDAVRQGRGPELIRSGGGGSAWPLDEVTESAVQRSAPLTARPALREGQPYTPYAAPRRSALPPEDVAGADEAMAARRAAAFGSGPSGPPPSTREPTRGPPPAPAATRATAVPEVRRPAPSPRQQASPEGAVSERTRYAPPSVEQRLGGRPSVDDLVREREGGAMLQMGLAGYEGARRAHNFVAAPVGAAIGITKEALRNPAVRARAISLFRLDRLAQVNPAVWGRVASTLQRAAQRDEEAGTTHHLKAANHVLLQRDAEYREADAAVASELQGLDDDALARRLTTP
jgi:hypothetical protein